jgi:hypothetical protein
MMCSKTSYERDQEGKKSYHDDDDDVISQIDVT